MAGQGERTIKVFGDLDTRLTMSLRGVPWRHALALAADALSARVTRDEEGVYSLRAHKQNVVNPFQAIAGAKPDTTVMMVDPQISFGTERPLELAIFS